MWVGTGVRLRVVKGQVSPTVLGWRSDGAERITPSPVVEASVNAKTREAHHGARPSLGVHRPSLIRVTRVRTSAYVRQFDVVTETGTYRVHITGHSASRRQAVTAFLPTRPVGRARS